MTLRLHRFLNSSRAEGPGLRASLWVQGCPIHCPGCAVPWTWSFEGGEEVEVDDLAARVLDEPGLEGITFLGGEPFTQAAALADLGGKLKRHGLSVMTFSGYTLEYLRASENPDYDALIGVTDLLIDGPFRQHLLDTSRPWVGSSNQRYHFLTPRYEELRQSLHNFPNKLEIRLSPNGKVEVNGLATQDEINQLLEQLTF